MQTDLPLSFQQQWLWNLLQQHPRWRSVVSYGYRIRGPLRVELLQTSLDEVLRRHESLRMSVSVADGLTHQHIGSSDRCPLDIVQLEAETQEDVEALATRRFEELCELECDPLSEPMLKVTLLRLSVREHWLVLSMHRLIADCASIDHVASEIWRCYGHWLENFSSPWDSAALQYGAYVSRQHGSDVERHRRHDNYWRERLSGARPIVWPTEARQLNRSRGELGSMSAWFDRELSDQLRAFSRKERTLAATAMLAAYAAVVWRWCGQCDFVMPFHVAGRQSEERAIVGYFSHVLCLRIQFTPDSSLTDVMRNIGNEFFRAMAHGDFGRMSTEAPALLSGAYFQWITWHSGEEEPLRVPPSAHPLELSVERVAVRDFGEGLTAIPPGVVAVETTFFDTPRGVFASGVYRSDLFSAPTMERFLGELQATVRQLVRDPSVRISQLASLWE